MRDLIDSGAAIAFGSDWPVSSSNPILGIATAVTRQTADAKPDGGWVIEQAVTVAEAFDSYSRQVSYQLTGNINDALNSGEPCDFVILDKNPMFADTVDLRNIKVLATYKDGHKIA
jgi:predicted amidohydrolase YtcJ